MKGFTLVELLAVVTIILVLSVIVLTNYRTGDQNLSLDESAVILGQDLRRAQEMAMSAKEFHGAIPRGGYGVYLKTNDDYYIIFADCGNTPNSQYDSTGTPCNGYPEKVEQVSLSKRGKIANLSPLSPLNVVFVPPNPTIIISGSGSQAVITLSLKENASSTRTVRVNKAGLIEAF